MTDEDESLAGTYKQLKQCKDPAECSLLFDKIIEFVRELDLFSKNEDISDVSTSSLKFICIEFEYAQHLYSISSIVKTDNEEDRLNRRLGELAQVLNYCTLYLKRCQNYDLIADKDLVNRALIKYTDLSTSSNNKNNKQPNISELSNQRQEKIQRYKLKMQMMKEVNLLESRIGKTEHCHDEELVREFYIKKLKLYTYEAFELMSSAKQEMSILISRLKDVTTQCVKTDDTNRKESDLDWKLDQLNLEDKMKLIDSKGRPQKPFLLVSSQFDRLKAQKDVFRPDWNLPTMTVDEYLEWETQRGGILPKNTKPDNSSKIVDEDNYEVADKATIKARAWDDFTDNNPRGSGNLMVNRG